MSPAMRAFPSGPPAAVLDPTALSFADGHKPGPRDLRISVRLAEIADWVRVLTTALPRRAGPWAPMVALLWLALLSAGGPRAATAQTEAPGCTDPANLPRLEGARILGCQTEEAAEAILPLAPWSPDPDVSFWESSLRLEGTRTRTLYAIPPGQGAQEVMRGYQKALVDLGYEVLFQCAGFNACGAGVDAVVADETYGKRLATSPAAGAFAEDTVREPRILVAKGPAKEGSAYLFVFAAQQDNTEAPEAGRRVAVFLEELISRGLAQPLILLRADELAQGLDLDGHIPVYGVSFDPDLAETRPESERQLAEIARLLRERAGLSLHVVGHTDGQGDLAHNLDLSRRRAEAVVTALTRDYGIDQTRLSPHGLAGLAPIAPSSTEEGRAMNWRIELVAR